MEEQRIKEYNISRMMIRGDVLSWEGHALRIQGISRIWVGEAPKKPFPRTMVFIGLLLALSGVRVVNTALMLVLLAVYLLLCGIPRKQGTSAGGTDHVNLELVSGEIYSFAAGSEAFAGKLYETLKQLLEAGGDSPHYEIMFEDGGEIIDRDREDRQEKMPGMMEAEQADAPGGKLAGELKKLYECYTAKADTDGEILSLINETGNMVKKNDREGLKSAFGRFVTSGLINDCNELGLDSLLQEIRMMIY